MDSLSNARAMQTATGEILGARRRFSIPSRIIQDTYFLGYPGTFYFYLGMRRNIYRDRFRIRIAGPRSGRAI